MISYQELDHLNTQIGIVRRKWVNSLDPRRFSGEYKIDPQKQAIRDKYKKTLIETLNNAQTQYVAGWDEMFKEFERLRTVIMCTPCRSGDYADTQKACRIIPTTFVTQRGDTVSFSIEPCQGPQRGHQIILHGDKSKSQAQLKRLRPYDVFPVDGKALTLFSSKEEEQSFYEYLRKNVMTMANITKEHIKEQLLYDAEKLESAMAEVPPPYALAF